MYVRRLGHTSTAVRVNSASPNKQRITHTEIFRNAQLYIVKICEIIVFNLIPLFIQNTEGEICLRTIYIYRF